MSLWPKISSNAFLGFEKSRTFLDDFEKACRPRYSCWLASQLLLPSRRLIMAEAEQWQMPLRPSHPQNLMLVNDTFPTLQNQPKPSPDTR